MRLEMPDKIPRTEYSAETHWKLVQKVTGRIVGADSSIEEKQEAITAFTEAWDYGMFWNVYLLDQKYGDCYTRMGHAGYAEGGTDFNALQYCPFDSVESVLDFDPREQYGFEAREKIKGEFEQDYRHKTRVFPDTVNMTGIYVTCVSGLIEMFGWDMLLTAAGTDPIRFGEVTGRYAEWMQSYFDALADTDIPIVMIHDDIVWTSGPFLHPEWYRRFVFPHYKKYFAPLRESGKTILFTSDGNYTAFIDDIAACGVNGFVLEPLTDMDYMAEKYGQSHIIVGNADTRILLNGTKDDIYREVKRCVDIGKKCPGFFMAVGNHIPCNTPVENALYYQECFEKLRRR